MVTAKTSTAEARLMEAIFGIKYKEPGSGSIEFARPYMAGYTFTSAMPIVQQLMEGKLHDASDKRVKRCAWCNYFYRDATRPNNSVVCSPECRDDRRKASQRKAHVPKPKKPTARERYYTDHLEYPFWRTEYDMLKQSWKHEVPYSTDKIEQIRAARQRKEIMGGRKKPQEVIAYNGDEKGVKDIRVRFSDYGQRKPGEVVTYKMERGEIDAHLLETYGEKKLHAEKRRTVIFYKGHRI